MNNTDHYQIWENKYKNKLNFDKNKFKIIAKIKCRRKIMEIRVGDFVKLKNGKKVKIDNVNDWRPPEAKYASFLEKIGDYVFFGEKDIVDVTDTFVREEDIITPLENDIKIIEEWCEREEKIIEFTDNEELKKYGKMMIKALVNILGELSEQKDWYETKLQEENQKYEELLEKYKEMSWNHGF